MATGDVKLYYTLGTTTTNATGELETALAVECSKEKKPLGNEEVELFVAGQPVEKKKTDATGKASFTVKCPAGTTLLKGELKSLPNRGQQRWMLNIASAPTPATVQTTTPPPTSPQAGTTTTTIIVNASDPVELQVLRSELPDAGKFRIFARVLNHKGKGLAKKKVGFVFQGKLEEVETSPGGVCQFPSKPTESIDLQPGDEKKVTAFVSGIAELTTTNVCRRRELSAQDKEAAQANNQRARLFLKIAGIAFAVWIGWFILGSSFGGWGEPLISTERTALTAQEKFFNTVPGVPGTTWEVKAEPISGRHMQKTILFLPLGVIVLWTIFSILYGIIALREEVAEAWRVGMEALIDKHYVRAQDPFFDRLAAWSGHLSRVRTMPATGTAATAEAPEATAVSSKKFPNFMDFFKSSLLADLIAEIVPRIFRAIIGRR